MKMCMAGVRGHYPLALHRLPALPQVQLVGICAGTTEDTVERLVKSIELLTEQPTPPVFDDYREMLDRTRPDIVTVAGPFALHAEMSIEALQRGIAVCCEKPVAISLEQLQRLKTAQTESGALLGSMMSSRYDPLMLAARQAVARGAVGPIRLIDTRKSYKRGNRPDYYHHRETYGGTIPWVGSHAIDWIQWFCGPERPFQSVYASHSACGDHGVGTMELTAQCQFRIAGDILAACSIDVLRPAQAPSHGDARMRIVGETGVLEIQEDEARLINADADGVQRLEPVETTTLFEDFVAHLEGRSAFRIPPQDTFAVTEACLLARESADHGTLQVFPGAQTA